MKYFNFKHLIIIVFMMSLIPIKNEITASFFHRIETLEAIPSETSTTVNKDLPIIKRIVEAYRHSASITENRGDSMWQLFFDQRHEKLHKVFLQGSLDSIAEILRNPGNSDMFYGFDALALSLLPAFANPEYRQNNAMASLDGLVRFAEAIGAISLDNPESYGNIPAIHWQADTIVHKIREVLGKPIIFPTPYPNEHGVWTSYGIVSYRVPQALYQAYRIKQLLKHIEHPRVLEIGAGLGRTAYYARILGIKDYTIVDLPFTALSSGYFLGCTLGEDQILYSGEQTPDAQERIKILSPEEFLNSNRSYDLIINADGFTEMDPKIAQAYWKKIEKCSPLFLSINHEINSFKVKTLVDESSSRIQVDRHLYWMRNGYVEEVVRFNQN